MAGKRLSPGRPEYKQARRQDRTLTQLGTTLGTPAYMPPEQVTGDLDRIGPASDVYSLGVILFQLLTGRLPFEGGTAAEVYGKILYTEAPAPSSLRPRLPAALDVICRKAMAKPPEGRYRSMKEFSAALAEFLKAAPWAETAGDMKTARIKPADIFQAPTIAPKGVEAALPSLAKRLDLTEPVGDAGGKKVRSSGRRHMPRWTLGVWLILCGAAGVAVVFWMTSANRSEPAGDTITNSIGMKLKLIRAGWFTMGSPHSDRSASDDEMPQHEVQITRPFYLGVYPVTKGQFSAFVRDDGYQTEAEKAGYRMTWRDPGFDYVQTDNDPVVNGADFRHNALPSIGLGRGRAAR